MSDALAFQSPKLITGFLNQEAGPGLGTPLLSPSGSIVQQYLGWLGTSFALDAKTALQLSDTVNVGTLYEGIYKFVQMPASLTTTPDVGYPLFWTDRKNYIVSPDITAAKAANFAGVAITKAAKNLINNYIPIQIAGRATVKMGTIQNGSAADGDSIFLDVSQGLFNDLTATDAIVAGGTAANAPNIRLFVGAAINGGTAPASAALVIINLMRSWDTVI